MLERLLYLCTIKRVCMSVADHCHYQGSVLWRASPAEMHNHVVQQPSAATSISARLAAF
jgi:hypothetical protein